MGQLGLCGTQERSTMLDQRWCHGQSDLGVCLRAWGGDFRIVLLLGGHMVLCEPQDIQGAHM